jgi:hypothetical protein
MRDYYGTNTLFGQIIGKNEIGYTAPYTQREILPGNWNKQTYEFGYDGACDGIAFSENDVYIFGDHSIVHYNGSNWNLEESVQTPYCAYAFNRNFIYAGGWSGINYFYDGNGWCEYNLNTNNLTITGAYGIEYESFWVTTTNGGLFDASVIIDTPVLDDYNDNIQILKNGPVDFEDVWGISSDNLYIAGEKGVVIHYNGYIWSREKNIPIKQTLNSIWGFSENDIYIVGDWGTILHFNGTTWSLHESCTKENLYDIWGLNNSDIYAVGNNGTIIHYNGSYWQLEDGETNQDLITVFGYFNQNENNYSIWTAGTGNEILKKIVAK